MKNLIILMFRGDQVEHEGFELILLKYNINTKENQGGIDFFY